MLKFLQKFYFSQSCSIYTILSFESGAYFYLLYSNYFVGLYVSGFVYGGKL